MLRDRNIVGSMQGKPRLWRGLLLFQSGNLPASRKGSLERSEHRKSLTPSGVRLFAGLKFSSSSALDDGVVRSSLLAEKGAFYAP